MKIEISKYTINPGDALEATLLRDAMDMTIDAINDGDENFAAEVRELKEQRRKLPYRSPHDYQAIELSASALGELAVGLSMLASWAAEEDAEPATRKNHAKLVELAAAVSAISPKISENVAAIGGVA